MVNLFDGLESSAFDIVTNTMGYNAVWIPSDDSEPLGYTAQVLFKDPDAESKLSGESYSSYKYEIEYKKGLLPGLKELVDTSVTDEVITVKSVDYLVRSVNTKYDGNTCIALLELKPLE